jgi:leucyl aminopeptidase
MPTVSAETTVPADATLVGVPVATGPKLLSDVDVAVPEGFEGKLGETATSDGTVFVGVGAAGEVPAETIRRASAALVKESWKRTSVVNTLLDAVPADGDRVAAAQAAAEGSLLASYRFGRYKKDATAGASKLDVVTIVAKGGKRVRDAVDRGSAIAGAVMQARDLVNTPAGDLTPPMFADIAVEVAQRAGLTIEVIDEKKAAKLGLGGIVGVGKGSDNPPRLVKLTYEPAAQARGHLAFVGKGITFDSGGLSIKTAEGMETMKTDKSGAAAVLGAMSVIAALAPPVRVLGIIPATENMPGGSALKPGDVLTARNGKTIEVLNTDAEGRLVLADGLSLAVEAEVDAIIDVATLTGACVIALGRSVAGRMGNPAGWIDQVGPAAARAGEDVWPLPLPEDYRKQIDSEVADIKNIGGGRYGGALTAGLFLREFVGDIPWAHLDIAGPARSEEDEGYLQKGGTGFGVRTLVEAVMGFRKPF